MSLSGGKKNRAFFMCFLVLYTVYIMLEGSGQDKAFIKTFMQLVKNVV